MFGRLVKKLKNNKIQKNTLPQEETLTPEAHKQRVEASVAQAKEDRGKARAEGRKYGEEFIGRDIQGLDPKRRSAMQFEAARHIDRGTEGAQRKLLGEQGQRGISGKSGVGFAQQRDLLRGAQEQKNQSLRDIDKLDYDTSLKKLAQLFAIESGEVSQAQLDKQMAIDEIRQEQERKRLKDLEDKFYGQFTRI